MNHTTHTIIRQLIELGVRTQGGGRNHHGGTSHTGRPLGTQEKIARGARTFATETRGSLQAGCSRHGA
eukprot:4897673-Lingulodinium_polyedra.AAC.1